MTYYRNIETDQILTLEDIKADFEQFKKEDPVNYGYTTFAEYMNYCLSKNGSLRKLLSADEVKSTFSGNVNLYAWADDLFYYHAVYSSYFDDIFFSSTCYPEKGVNILGYSISY